jgi:chromate transporter
VDDDVVAGLGEPERDGSSHADGTTGYQSDRGHPGKLERSHPVSYTCRMAAPAEDTTPRLLALARLFLKLGITAFGGPAAHIGMLEEEVVQRRRWSSRDHFLDLVGATNLIPGPNSTEMVLHVGYERARVAGMVVAGASFILPAFALTTLLAWAYVRFGALPDAVRLLTGIQPVVVAIIAGAVWRLGRTAVRSVGQGLLGLAVAVAVVVGVGELTALFAGILVGGLAGAAGGPRVAAVFALPFGAVAQGTASVAPAAAAAAAPVSLWKLALFFSKIGAVLFGSGYVLVAFIEGDLVETLGWLTRAELLDAIAIGQLTPGPILTTAAVVGFITAGFAGAAVATVAIFLPAFIFVPILNPLVPRLRASRWTAAFLDAVNVSAVGLMAAVLVPLAGSAVGGWFTGLLLVVALVSHLVWRVSGVWLVVGGGVLGAALGG